MCGGQVPEFLDPSRCNCHIYPTVPKSEGSTDPVDAGAELAFLSSLFNAKQGPHQHGECHAVTAFIGRTSKSEHRVINISLTGRRAPAASNRQGKFAD